MNAEIIYDNRNKRHKQFIYHVSGCCPTAAVISAAPDMNPAASSTSRISMPAEAVPPVRLIITASKENNTKTAEEIRK